MIQWFIGALEEGGNPVVDPPVTEKAYTVYNEFESGNYMLLSSLAQKVSNPNIVNLIYTDGVGPGWDNNKLLKFQQSADKGLTFSAPVTIYDGSPTLAAQECHSGWSSDGKYHITLLLTSSVDARTLIHLVSDDDGATYAETDITSIVSDPTYTHFANSGEIIENNGVLLQGVYFTNATSTVWKIGVLKYEADTWTLHTVAIPITAKYETSLIALSGNNIILIIRDEATGQYTQYSSGDNGDTWSLDGAFDTGITSTAWPANLNSFTYKGVKMIAFYFPRSFDNNLYALYGFASDLLSGVSGWNMNSTRDIATPTENYMYHGTSLHYNDNFNALGAWPDIRSDFTFSKIRLFEIDTTDWVAFQAIMDA